MTPELLPCAHCGGIASCFTKALDERMGYVRVCTVTCKSCGARVHAQDGTDANGWAKDNTAEAKAIAAWNTRAPLPPAALAELPEVRELMRQAYLHGFSASAEGYNREWPFDDKNIDPETDDDWTKDRESAFERIAAAIREARND